MKKYILILFIFGVCILPVHSQIITGGVEYDEQSAQQEILNSPVQTLNSSLVSPNLFDKNRQENLRSLLNGNVDLKDRTLASFSDGTYGVIYKDNPANVWYYTNFGNLMHFEVKTSLSYPYRTYKYTPNHKLVNMSLRVSDKESYIFDKQGGMIAHWLGKNCYNSKGEIIMRRKIYN